MLCDYFLEAWSVNHTTRVALPKTDEQPRLVCSCQQARDFTDWYLQTAYHPECRLTVCVAQGEDATVTVVHSRTPNPQAICAEADIIVAGIGKPEMVRGDWIKPGAAVIDVGTNPIPVQLSSHSPPLVRSAVQCLLRSHRVIERSGFGM